MYVEKLVEIWSGVAALSAPTFEFNVLLWPVARVISAAGFRGYMFMYLFLSPVPFGITSCYFLGHKRTYIFSWRMLKLTDSSIMFLVAKLGKKIHSSWPATTMRIQISTLFLPAIIKTNTSNVGRNIPLWEVVSPIKYSWICILNIQFWNERDKTTEFKTFGLYSSTQNKAKSCTRGPPYLCF